VLKNSDAEGLIHEQDIPALKSLIDIRSVNRDKEFDLIFHFADNPYFNNKVLTKTYIFDEELDGSEVPKKVQGTEINWKYGKNLTVQTITQKSDKKKKGKAKLITKSVSRPSFFQFFQSMDAPHEDPETADAEEEMERFEFEFEIAQDMKERIIPLAVLFLTGECVSIPSFQDFQDLDGSENEDDGDEDDEDDEEEEDDSEEEIRGRKGKPLKAKKQKKVTSQSNSSPFGASTPNSVEQPPECKQQ